MQTSKTGVREVSKDTKPTTDSGGKLATRVFKFGYDQEETRIEVKPQQRKNRAGMYFAGSRMTNDELSEMLFEVGKGIGRPIFIRGIRGSSTQLVDAIEVLKFYLEAQEENGDSIE